MLPFRVGTRVVGDEFCGRRRELAQLREYMRGRGRVYVVGERRVGKTSLIFEAQRTLRGARLIYVDCLGIKVAENLTHRLAAAVLATESRPNRVLELMKGLARLRPVLGVDPITNTPTITFAPGSGSEPETLDAVFRLFGSWKSTVVAFDEFQDTLALPAEEALLPRLRGLIQKQDEVGFVFAGSVRHRMESIFTSEDSPFFKAAMRLHVGPLDRDEFSTFLAGKFASGKRRLRPGLLGTIMDLCHDNPGDVQRLCIAVWQVTSSGQVVDGAALSAALNMLLAMHGDAYGEIVRGLSAQQAQALRALAQAGGRAKLTREFLESTGITLLPSLAKAMNTLLDKGIVRKDETEYRIVDPFLGAWLRRFAN